MAAEGILGQFCLMEGRLGRLRKSRPRTLTDSPNTSKASCRDSLVFVWRGRISYATMLPRYRDEGDENDPTNGGGGTGGGHGNAWLRGKGLCGAKCGPKAKST